MLYRRWSVVDVDKRRRASGLEQGSSEEYVSNRGNAECSAFGEESALIRSTHKVVERESGQTLNVADQHQFSAPDGSDADRFYGQSVLKLKHQVPQTGSRSVGDCAWCILHGQTSSSCGKWSDERPSMKAFCVSFASYCSCKVIPVPVTRPVTMIRPRAVSHTLTYKGRAHLVSTRKLEV